mmetsp:Transcript_44055/g.104331  ORF Transcript_44055/g.104331 Transcript_44055/m.104331 type:complete len:217 (-) Transcript_44055:25-675(-)|eukprot:CAMPEP_0177719916 /NCGR_PEP_ID=MMETSP0484_2-20121128/16358_1 /TAXON_ID=354590 /ORGANISM="Rhodomonas lens, Strain RHODO" /LENGTH=216 /DNA_ID=CAMNT_0019232165 /DNA_START=104 /DNA_END=754 /DNA_ORIENTATION=-
MDMYQARMRHSKYDGANGLRPKKMLSHILKIVSLLENGSTSEVEAAYQLFLKDAELYKFSMGKIQVVADTSEREVDAYKEVQDKLKEQMVQTEGEIEKLKDRVAHERVVRKNKEEYATLAKQVETLAPRKQTEKDRAVLQEQINRLEEQTQTQHQTLEMRKKQFMLLLHLVEDLKKGISEEEELESMQPAPSIDPAALEAVSPAADPDVEMGEAGP